jgi:fatty-acyl-CoA synthase
MLRGLMMDRPLLVPSILDHAAARYGPVEMVSCTADAPGHRTTYAALSQRAKQLARALQNRLGVRPGERVATLAWNDHRHFELYYAVAGIGAVCHTINPRLFPDQIAYIVNHAEDRYLFTDPMFVPLLEQLAPELATLERIVVLSDAGHMPASGLTGLVDYESLISDPPA